MGRRVHIIKANHTTEVPCHAVWFDTETTQHDIGDNTVEHRLSFGWAAYRRKRTNGQWTKPRWYRFETAEDFWGWIESLERSKIKLYMFCHNTSFDIPVLDAFNQLAKREFKINLAVIDAPPTIVKLRRKTFTIVLLDTLNIFRMPLKKLGEIIGLEKFDMPSVAERSEAGDKYCQRDVEIIMMACLKWFDFIVANDLGGFANTLAGQAMRAYRHRFMMHDILIDSNDKATFLSREAYYGGRTECFRLGEIADRTSLLDVNSMYPAVMRGVDYPSKLLAFTRRASVKDLRQWLKEYCVCAHVEVNTDVPAYPLRTPERLVFPVGRFQTYLSTPELRYALERGHIARVLSVAVYHRAPIFTEYVDFFYNMRLECAARGESAMALMHKNLLTNLYGKFGQRGMIWESDGQTDNLNADAWIEKDVETGKIIRHRQLGGLKQVQSDERESRDSHPAIAAHVTAEARMLLWSYIETAGRENVYYCDTDSLLVNDDGRARLVGVTDPARLGALKVEGEFEDATIYGAKDYRFGNKERHKGVKKNAQWLTPNKVEQEQWSSLKGLVRAGRTDRPTTRKVQKQLARIYTKGTPTPEGIILPLVMGEVSASLRHADRCVREWNFIMNRVDNLDHRVLFDNGGDALAQLM